MSRKNRPKLNLILTEDELKFAYTERELKKFRKYWRRARTNTKDTLHAVNQVAKESGELPDNVLLLALDQIRKGKIE